MRMRKTAIAVCALGVALVGCQSMAVSAPRAPIEVEKGALDPAGGHVQGFCASDGAFYVTQMKTLYKFDWTGRLLKKAPVVCHTGDICFWEGHVYTSVSVYQGPDKGKGIIQVFDADLNLVREAKLDKSTDGITILDGVLYLGMGSNHVPSKESHRENFFRRYDPKTLQPLGPRQIVDFGYMTHYGAQDISHDGKNVLVSFYRGEKGAPAFVAFDRDLKPVKLVRGFEASNGFDLLPRRMRGERPLYARVQTLTATDPAKPKKRIVSGCRLTFFEYADGAVKEVK